MTESDAQVAVRATADLSVGSSSRVPAAAELRDLDRQIGWIVVNRWTYRIIRRLGGLSASPPKLEGLRITEEPDAGQGVLVVGPDHAAHAGALFLIHGGGYVVGSSRELLGKAAAMARACGIPVFCPAYRLAPEHPFPAAHDDCYAAWIWLVANAGRFGVDPQKVVIGGVSAGGGLAAGLATRLRDEGGVQPSGQLLVYPMLDDRTAAARELDSPRHRVWSNRSNLFGWTSYLGQSPGQPVPRYAVPARCEDLSGLPPAWIGVGTSDLFLDEDRAYAEQLRDAGVHVDYVEAEGGIHGFDHTETKLGRAFAASQIDFVQNWTA